MSRAIVIQLAPQSIRAIIARSDGDALKIDDILSVPVEGADLTGAEKQFAAQLEAHHPQKAKVLVAVPSSSIKWQYLSLPPSPPEDLPAIVKLQLDVDGSRDEEAIGYDFLPFAGSGERPQRVLAMILRLADLARVRNFYRVAGLKVDHVVPLSLGWPALGDAFQEPQAATSVFVAIQDKEATFWSTTAGQLTLLRQVKLAEELESDTVSTSVASQLRRTLLNLSQEGFVTDKAQILLVGEPEAAVERLAESLGGEFSRTVKALALPTEVVIPASFRDQQAELLPLLGLAWQAVGERKPLLDFLHPRKPPEPKSNHRAMVLAGIAGSLLAAIIGWQGYANLKGPLWTAAALQEELATVKKEAEPLEAEERDAARIRDWLASSPNLLTELASLAKDWRPEHFDSPNYKLAKDGVLKRIDLSNRRLVLTGNVANSDAVQSLENRLRDSGHRVRREKSEPATDGGQYPWEVQIVIDVGDGEAADDDAMRARP